MADLNSITNALIAGDGGTVETLVKQSMDEGIEAKEILNTGLIKGMDIVGEKMETGDMFIPEVLRSAKIMSMAVEILKPQLASDDIIDVGKVVIGTVKGDLHDIGKNLVKMMLESAGFELIDLGIDVAPENFVKAVKENNVDVVALSSLLTTTMNMMNETVKHITESGLRDKVSIVVGGAPVTQEFADKIGADGYARDAVSAKKLLQSLLK